MNENLTTLKQELENRNAELSALTDHVSNLLLGVDIPIVILDANFRIRRFNPIAEKVLNLIPADVGRSFRDVRSGLEIPDWDKLVSEVMDHQRVVDRKVRGRNGPWYNLRIRPYKTGEHKIDGVLMAWLDVPSIQQSLAQVEGPRAPGATPISQVEAGLDESESRVRTLLESAAQAVVAVDRGGSIRLANLMTETMFGYRRDELLGQSVEILLPERLRTQHAGHRAEYFSSPRSRPMGRGYDLKGRRKDGTEFPVEVSLSYMDIVDGMLAVSFISDITERKRNEEARAQYQRELQEFTARLISVQESESKQLARELHDVFSQKLVVLGMEVSALEKQLGGGQTEVAERLRVIGQQIGGLANDIHQMSRQLHPSILEDLGLAAALKNECARFSEQGGIPVVFKSENLPEALSEDIALCLYRVAQESLRNIAKHAEAREVRVTLSRSDNTIELSIQDVGNGFDLAEVRGKGGLGLVSMEERVRLVKGHFAIKSQPGSGTFVQVRVPLQ